ncbi:hypothetical protein HELRODRAFT_164843 [Helobdella robusta]|uniref:Uncharacterized protein n=1 Tax=Helobdella robusta TaxID=6412 RepID=T1EVV7_HELRO|nr:hypothetical protein HELRODRAFT_164843 [Helobdella robusta]ESN92744.1 hypothetical protein HELRODRAFT_164843 [Helobdella robusta]
MCPELSLAIIYSAYTMRLIANKGNLLSTAFAKKTIYNFYKLSKVDGRRIRWCLYERIQFEKEMEPFDSEPKLETFFIKSNRFNSSLLTFLKSCGEFTPSEASAEGKLLTKINYIKSEFSEKIPRMKKVPDELCKSEALASVENVYQGSTLKIIDRIIRELSDKFEAFNNVNSMFRFLSGVEIEKLQI